MTDRKYTPFTNEHFVTFCEKMLGQPYWYGTCMYKCTESLRSRKSVQYPSHYSSGRINRYRQDIAGNKVCADCIGGAKGYAWTGGGVGVMESIGTGKTIASKYGSNGCPDRSANGMFSYAKSKGMDWGTIGSLPEIVGLALHKSGHVGYYIGHGYAIEWRGYAYGCVKTKVVGRGWTHWYKLPFIQYGAVVTPATPDKPDTADSGAQKCNFGTRLLRYRKHRAMLRGDDVLAIQARLTELGFDPGKADGVYGPKTTAAVIAFQTERKIAADGIVGPITRSALS